MDEETNIFYKDGLKFIRIKKNNYNLQFMMENENIILSNIIDFSLIKLIYDLNPDIYEKVHIENITKNEVIINLLMKHFFEDLGLPQRFSFVHMKKIEEDNRIIFKSQTIKTHRPVDMPEDSELLNMENLTAICEIITPHKILFNFNIVFENNMNIPKFAEKMVSVIIHKIFKRVKQFIENVRL
jgi:hypothetical protein